MKSLNSVQLIGEVADISDIIESETTQTVLIKLITSHAWKNNRTGEMLSESETHELVFFNNKAVSAHYMIHPGMTIFARGFIKTTEKINGNRGSFFVKQIIVHDFVTFGNKKSHGNDDNYEGGNYGM